MVRPNRLLVAVFYLTAALLIFVPLLEVGVSVFPWRLGSEAWRFGTAGVLSQALLTPVLGLTLLIAVTLWLGNVRTLAAIGIGALLVAAIMSLLFVTFGLDAFQMRAQVRAEMGRAFDLSSAFALVKLMAGAIIAALAGIGARRTARGLRRQQKAAP